MTAEVVRLDQHKKPAPTIQYAEMKRVTDLVAPLVRELDGRTDRLTALVLKHHGSGFIPLDAVAAGQQPTGATWLETMPAENRPAYMAELRALKADLIAGNLRKLAEWEI